MITVRMHVDGRGVLWAMAKCRVCGQIHKYLASDAVGAGVRCRSCGRPLELAGAVIEAAQRGDQHDGSGEAPSATKAD